MTHLILLKALCQTNQGLLHQKASLLRTMVHKFGAAQAGTLYIQQAPPGSGSLGQHVRHSLDHMSRALDACNNNGNNSFVYYDRRERATPDETNVDHALERIAALHEQFQDLSSNDCHDETTTMSQKKVIACFMLSSDDSGQEYELPSTVARELGFAAHHAMHHMAMIKRIVMTEGKLLQENDFPADFGTAPSTAFYNKTNNS